MKAKGSVAVVAAMVAAGLWLPAAATAGDWPQYRGPSQDGRSTETGLLGDWSEAAPPRRWQVPLGDGYSGISVADGRVYTLFGRDDDEFAVCLDAADGRELWRVRTDANRRDTQGDGPRSTPTVDGGRVFALSAGGKLHALEAASGAPLWSVDLVAELGAEVPTWGVSTSPLVEGELLLVDVGGREGYSLVAFDKATGEVRWHSGDDRAGYSTPLAVTAAGVRQILFFTGTALVSAAPADGRIYWRYPWSTAFGANAAMPVFLPPKRVFISSPLTGAAVLEMSAAGGGVDVTEIWRSRRMRNHFSSSVLVAGHLYGFDNGTLKCIDAVTGEERWAQRGFGKGSLLYADGSLIVLGERGQLARVAATPAGYREHWRTRIFEARTWTMPTLADGRLFLRSREEIVALDLGR